MVCRDAEGNKKHLSIPVISSASSGAISTNYFDERKSFLTSSLSKDVKLKLPVTFHCNSVHFPHILPPTNTKRQTGAAATKCNSPFHGKWELLCMLLYTTHHILHNTHMNYELCCTGVDLNSTIRNDISYVWRYHSFLFLLFLYQVIKVIPSFPQLSPSGRERSFHFIHTIYIKGPKTGTTPSNLDIRVYMPT